MLPSIFNIDLNCHTLRLNGMAIYNLFMDMLAFIHWRPLRRLIFGKGFRLSAGDHRAIKRILSTGYYIILTEDRTHLSSWAVKLATFALTKKPCRYTHALVNVEPDKATEFKFVEALNKGVKQSSFNEVFECDSVCILKPKRFTIDEIDEAIGASLRYIGLKYDKKFRYNDAKELSCVEVARNCLKMLPEYSEKMRIFEYMIQTKKNLVPQMLRDCPDFEVVREFKR